MRTREGWVGRGHGGGTGRSPGLAGLRVALALLAAAACAWGCAGPETGPEKAGARTAAWPAGGEEGGPVGTAGAAGGRPVRHLPSFAREALDAARLGARIFVGRRRGGVWESFAAGERVWGLGAGLPSGVARFVLADERRQRIYVGTDHGLAILDPVAGRARALLTPWEAAPDPALRLDERLGRERRAGPAALSPDGTLLFQFRAEGVLERPLAPAVLLELAGGQVAEWRPPEDVPLAELTDAEVDGEGCLLLAGLVSGPPPGPAVLRRCGRRSRGRLLADVSAAGRTVRLGRPLAIAALPRSGEAALAAEVEISEASRRRADVGLFRLDAGLSAAVATPGSEALGHAVTDLLWDPERETLLVATPGRGLLELRAGRLEALAPGLPPEIAAVRHAARGTLLVATPEGAFEVDRQRRRARLVGPEDRGQVPADSDPAAVGADGRVLLASYAGGLSLVDGGGREPRVERLRPGAEVPDGLYGDAVFFADGIAAVVHGRGVAWRAGCRGRLLGPGDGLAGSEAHRLLALPGELWIAHRPVLGAASRGGVVERWRGDGVDRVLPGDALPGAVADWVAVPERGSVFAATRTGVIEIRSDGRVERVSRSAVAALARDPASGTIGAAGSALERWDGERFRPLLFRLPHPRRPEEVWSPGPPLDLAIDAGGNWHLLFRGGALAVLSADGEVRAVLDPADGLPPTARSLLAHPGTGELWVGSAAEGVTILGPARP